MSLEVLTPERVNVGYAMDVVRAQLGTHSVVLYYQHAFALGRLMRVRAKDAMRFDGNKIRAWNELAKFESSEPVTPLHPYYRRSDFMQNVKTWDATRVGLLVLVQLNELSVGFHYADALRFQAMLRVSAKNAKHWAGDFSRTMKATALLTDAEENYKLGS